MPGGFKKKNHGGKRDGAGRKPLYKAPEYLLNSNESTRKSMANSGEDLSKRGRPCESTSGPQSPDTKRAKAKEGMKKIRISEKRRMAVSKRKDRQKEETSVEEENSDECEEEEQSDEYEMEEKSDHDEKAAEEEREEDDGGVDNDGEKEGNRGTTEMKAESESAKKKRIQQRMGKLRSALAGYHAYQSADLLIELFGMVSSSSWSNISPLSLDNLRITISKEKAEEHRRCRYSCWTDYQV